MASNFLGTEVYDRLSGYVEYNPEDGTFICTDNGKPIGSVSSGYMHLAVRGTQYKVKAHRFAWYATHGYVPKIIDHIDQDPLNNRLSNLREVNRSQNAMNARMPSDNTSGCRGVSWRENRQCWRAYITKGKKQIFLGNFKVYADAVSARRDAERLVFGSFAPTTLPHDPTCEISQCGHPNTEIGEAT